ncbi:hypothetical protein [Fonticella tunisiensis]|uniref:Uncharacterized protein n=1 Tax=Fonticella tunisiensis TaxID=1096341 RepID=A0A4R7KW06_9CLOT|nr:hypothetical protein [Fonticella tunisiensis]TDT62795.1 hypothetical protein EDD71_10368 [Fonticella tunisiensis]
MKKRKAFLKYFILILAISNLIIAISRFNIHKQRGYYIGKIESINQKDGIATMEVSPISSRRYFISEIKANHQIKYKLDSISVSGIADPNKKHKIPKLGELGEMVKKFKVGDTIIFKVANNHYDKNEYILEIEELAVDLTLE